MNFDTNSNEFGKNKYFSKSFCSSKTNLWILIFFSIAMSADYSFNVKTIEIWVSAFFKHNNSSVATVIWSLFCPVLIGRILEILIRVN